MAIFDNGFVCENVLDRHPVRCYSGTSKKQFPAGSHHVEIDLQEIFTGLR